jgi:hypothetical protein
MSKEVKRYRLRAGMTATALAFVPETVVAASSYDALLAERDALKKDAERYQGMRAVVIAEREGCTEALYDEECDRLLEAYDAALQGEQP